MKFLLRSHSISFSLGEEVDDVTMDGRKVGTASDFQPQAILINTSQIKNCFSRICNPGDELVQPGRRGSPLRETEKQRGGANHYSHQVRMNIWK